MRKKQGFFSDMFFSLGDVKIEKLWYIGKACQLNTISLEMSELLLKDNNYSFKMSGSVL